MHRQILTIDATWGRQPSTFQSPCCRGIYRDTRRES